MRGFLPVAIAALLARTDAGGVQTIYATGNPHTDGGGAGGGCDGATALITPENIVYDPKATQADTLQRIVTVSLNGVPIPVYFFRQPARLNPDQLPFKIVLLRSISGLEGAHVIDTPDKRAYDSWFPGYRWDVVVTEGAKETKGRWFSMFSQKGKREVTHMGWRFSNGQDTFYALIVDYAAAEKEGSAVLDSLSIGVAASPAILSMLMETQAGRSNGASAA